jgi:hypothetical protein
MKVYRTGIIATILSFALVYITVLYLKYSKDTFETHLNKVSRLFDGSKVTSRTIVSVKQKHECDTLLDRWDARNIHRMSSSECEQIEAMCLFSCKASVDAVYLWINGSDPKWQERKNEVVNAMNETEKKQYVSKFHINFKRMELLYPTIVSATLASLRYHYGPLL